MLKRKHESTTELREVRQTMQQTNGKRNWAKKKIAGNMKEFQIRIEEEKLYRS